MRKIVLAFAVAALTLAAVPASKPLPSRRSAPAWRPTTAAR